MIKKGKVSRRKSIILTYAILCFLGVLIIVNSVGILNNFWGEVFSSGSSELRESQNLEKETQLKSLSLIIQGDDICGDSSEVTIGGRLSGGFFKINNKEYLVKEGRRKNNAIMASLSVNNAEAGITKGESKIIEGLLVYVKDIREELDFGTKVYYADLILGENKISSPEDCSG